LYASVWFESMIFRSRKTPTKSVRFCLPLLDETRRINAIEEIIEGRFLAQRAPLVRSNVSGEKSGEKMDAVHKVRPTLWSVSLFLAVPPYIVEIA
jgi:hypothetical protein